MGGGVSGSTFGTTSGPGSCGTGWAGFGPGNGGSSGSGFGSRGGSLGSEFCIMTPLSEAGRIVGAAMDSSAHEMPIRHAWNKPACWVYPGLGLHSGNSPVSLAFAAALISSGPLFRTLPTLGLASTISISSDSNGLSRSSGNRSISSLSSQRS